MVGQSHMPDALTPRRGFENVKPATESRRQEGRKPIPPKTCLIIFWFEYGLVAVIISLLKNVRLITLYRKPAPSVSRKDMRRRCMESPPSLPKIPAPT